MQLHCQLTVQHISAVQTRTHLRCTPWHSIIQSTHLQYLSQQYSSVQRHGHKINNEYIHMLCTTCLPGFIHPGIKSQQPAVKQDVAQVQSIMFIHRPNKSNTVRRWGIQWYSDALAVLSPRLRNSYEFIEDTTTPNGCSSFLAPVLKFVDNDGDDPRLTDIFQDNADKPAPECLHSGFYCS